MAQTDKKGRGRPPAITDGDKLKIIRAATAGMSIPEIAAFLSVSKTAVINYLERNRKLKDEIETLKNKPKSLAKMIILEELENGNIDVSKWLLERELKLAGERERLKLIRVQREVLKNNNVPDNPPDAIVDLTGHWSRVDRYFRGEFVEKKTDNSPVDKE